MNQTESSTTTTVSDQSLRSIVKSQYHAALAMFGETIERCPDDLWLNQTPKNAFWQVAYHTLFYTHLYLGLTDADFRPWKEHQADVQNPDGIAHESRGSDDTRSLLPDPYTKTQVLEYWKICDDMVDDAVDAMDLQSSESGFSWYPIPKLEHQLVNIRHIQHGAAQLADRLRAEAGIGISWAGARRT